jgi:hypothetical protein
MVGVGEIEAAVASLVRGDPSRLVPESGAPVEVREIVVHPVIARRGDRVHLPVSVRCLVGGRERTIELWLKSRPGLAGLFPTLEAYSRRLGDGIFPRPLYAWRSERGDSSFLITERIQGEVLRDRLLKAALGRRTAGLDSLFHATGVKMRAFHDAFEPSSMIPVSAVVDDTLALVDSSSYLTTRERSSIRERSESRASVLATAGELPRLKIHGDWILRNIVVDRSGHGFVVDCDSMRAEDDLRWYDVAYFLINLESQMKWAPVVSRSGLAPLARAFNEGYLGSDSTVDSLSSAQRAALLYLIRVRYLLGGTLRVPLHRMFGGLVGGRYLRRLRAGLAAGEPTLL